MNQGIGRRTLLKGAAGLGVAALPVAAPAILPASRPFNVLLITSDQEQAWRKLPRTLGLRNHERLLERAVHFEQFYVNSVPCGPSRSNLYCGRHVQHTRIIDNPGYPPWPNSLDPAIPTLGTHFRRAGYRTVYKGKWHLSEIEPDPSGDHGRGLAAFGFDEYQRESEAYGLALDGHDHDPAIAADAARWLMRHGRGGDQPWLLAVNFLNPHDIMFFDATGEMRRNQLPVRGSPAIMKPGVTVPPYGRGPRVGLPANFRPHPTPELDCHRIFREDNALFLGEFDRNNEAAWLSYINYYADCLRDLDRHLGTVLDALDRSGAADRTVVMFTADHGEMAGAHGYRQKGPFIYSENLGVPMFVHHPDGARGATSKALGSAIDVVPTLLGLAGVDVAAARTADAGLVGQDLSGSVGDPAARGARDDSGILHVYSAIYTTSPEVRRKRSRMSFEADENKRAATAILEPRFIEVANRTFYRGAFDGRYRFARYFSPADHHRPVDWTTLTARNDLELYDTHADPLEQHNLARMADDNRTAIERMNNLVNTLTEAEVGEDDGRHMPGLGFRWKV